MEILIVNPWQTVVLMVSYVLNRPTVGWYSVLPGKPWERSSGNGAALFISGCFCQICLAIYFFSHCCCGCTSYTEGTV